MKLFLPALLGLVFCLVVIAPSFAGALGKYDCKRDHLAWIDLHTGKQGDTTPPDGKGRPDPDADDFQIQIIAAVPDTRCANPKWSAPYLTRWQSCQARFAIANDGYKQRPRSYSLATAKSDNGGEFYGLTGTYFYMETRGRYEASYSDDGGIIYIETGTCKSRAD